MKEAPKHSATNNHQHKPFFNASGPEHFFGGKKSEQDAFFTKTGAQPMLEVGKKDDTFERQADRTADKVVQRLNQPSAKAGPAIQAKEMTGAEDKLKKEEETEPTGQVQRKPVFESDEPLEQVPQVQKRALMLKGNGDPAAAPASVESGLQSGKGGGMPMDSSTKSGMESAFGADFSNVRIHNNSNAQQMSSELGAQAFTHGNDIYFNEGKYNPNSSSGAHLLAHELTHTLQQGGSVKKKPAPAIQKNPQPTGPPPGPPYKEKDHELDTSPNGKTLKIPKITLPDFKKRNEGKFKMPLHSLEGRPDTAQVKNWENAVKSAVNAKVGAFLENIQPDAKGLYYLKLKNSKADLIGTKKEIMDECYLPEWNRQGQANVHQVDHIMEMQLGGTDEPSNYELTDAVANGTSGVGIQQERYRRVDHALELFKNINVPNLPTRKEVNAGYIVTFDAVEKWNLPYGGNGKAYWSMDEVKLGKHLQHLRKMTADEIKESTGTDKELLVYMKPGLGLARRVAQPFAPVNNFIPGIDLVGMTYNSGAADGKTAGSMQLKLTQDFSDKLKANDSFTLEMIKVKGRDHTCYIHYNKSQQAVGDLLRFEGLSPVTINSLSFEEYGLALDGTIRSDIELLRDQVINFIVAGKQISFNYAVELESIKKYFPKIFNVTNVTLMLSYSNAKGLKIGGGIFFEIAGLGKGDITAEKAGKEFALNGNFLFDKSVFDGSITVGFSKSKGWSMGGAAKIPGGKIKGLKEANVKFGYAADVISVDGKATLSLPGISELQIKSTIGKNGNFSIETTLDLSKIPKLKGGTGTIAIKRVDGVWDLAISGSVTPDLSFSGLTVESAAISYKEGVFDIKVKASYKKDDKITGSGTLGITNKPVNADGTKGEGEGTRDMKFYGDLGLTINVIEDISGEIKAVIKPEGDIIVDGKIALKHDKPLFEFGDPINKPIIPKLDKNIPVASCGVVTLKLHIGGGVNFYANVEPLAIKEGSNISVHNFNLRNPESVEVTSSISIGSRVKAGLEASLEVGLDASLLYVLNAGIGGKVTLDFEAINAGVNANINVGWSPGKGFYMKDSEIKLDLSSKLIFGVHAYARVYLDLLLGTITLWSHDWELARKELKVGLFSGMESITIPLQANGNKLSKPDVDGKLSGIGEKGSDPEMIAKRTQDHAIDGKGQSDEDKKAEANDEIKKQIVALFTNPDRFVFNSSRNYLQDRYETYDYLKNEAQVLYHIDFSYLDELIRKCEVEEYDAFTEYMLAEKEFDENARATIVEDFITNHPMLNETEVVNLRSLIAVAPQQTEKPAPQKGGKKKTGNKKATTGGAPQKK